MSHAEAPRRNRAGLIAAVVALLALLAAAGVAAPTLVSDDRPAAAPVGLSSTTAPPPATAPPPPTTVAPTTPPATVAPSTTPLPTTTAAPTSSRAAPTTTAAPARAATVPRNWVTYTDSTVGYTIAHPPGWKVVRLDGTRTDFKDPAGGRYLRVDWTDTPGPSAVGAWEAYEPRFASEVQDYQRVAMEETTFQGYEAGHWEFEYTAGGTRLHAVDLGFITGPNAFALNFQTPAADWGDSQEVFEAFKASFRPPAA